jgi:hypothetical protein
MMLINLTASSTGASMHKTGGSESNSVFFLRRELIATNNGGLSDFA